jgi:hypothetical protein
MWKQKWKRCLEAAEETGSSTAERVKKFKELVKSGASVRRALKESKLHPQYYKQHYMEIWNDPELEPTRSLFNKSLDNHNSS